MASEKDRKTSEAKPMRLPRSPFVSPARKAGDLAMRPLSEALGARGFAGPEVIAQWPSIVGAALAACTAPERIVWPRHDPLAAAVNTANMRDSGATLHIRAQGPGAIEVQHMADLILERVNQFFGFQAVTRLRIVQAPISPQDRAVRGKSAQPPGLKEAKPIRIDGIEYPDLAMALARLGTAVRRSGR